MIIFILCALQIVIWPKMLYISLGADKTAAVGEPTDAGAEMTEEEWNLRVAELNKHQVTFAKKQHSNGSE